MDAAKVRALYDEAYAAGYDARFPLSIGRSAEVEHEVAIIRGQLSERARWLDVGCGTGWLLSRFPGVARGGLDISPSMLERAQAANPDALFLREGDLRDDVPEWHRQWTLVSATSMPYNYVESMAEIDIFLDNLTRWTAPGGAVFLPVMDAEDIHPSARLPYADEAPERGRLVITSITMTWSEADRTYHEHLIAPQVEYFVERLGTGFGTVEILRYPPSDGAPSRKAVLATGRGELPPGGTARVVRQAPPVTAPPRTAPETNPGARGLAKLHRVYLGAWAKARRSLRGE